MYYVGPWFPGSGNTPELTANVDLSYMWRFMDMSFGGRYYDSIWAKTTNTGKVSSFTTLRTSCSMRTLTFAINAR